MIQQGDIIAGKYRVERVLGAGGMGYVVAALHEQLGQRVAVKLLSPNLSEDADSVTRFLREARAAVRIRSEHVARVLDVGELTDGTPYMVMEFLSGNDLAEELDLPGEIEIAQAIDYVLQASEAVAEAHSLGVIHRDLKPANLFLTQRPDGTPLVKVLDFGISKAITTDDSGEHEQSLTATHSLLGSPAYMSPEQIRRPKHVDIRTDIWSLGSILWELLVRDPPFGADSPLALLAAVVSDPLPSLREKRADVPPELEAVIAKCMAKNPDERYQTVAELAIALSPFAPKSMPSVSRISGILRSSAPPVTADRSPSSDRTLQSPHPTPSGSQNAGPKVQVVTPFSPTEKSTKTDWEAGGDKASRSRRRVLVVGGGGVLVAVVLALWQWQGAGAATGSAAPERPAGVAPPVPAALPAPAEPPTAAEPAVTSSAAAPPSSASAGPATSGSAAAAAQPAASAPGASSAAPAKAPAPRRSPPVAAAPAAPAKTPAPPTPTPTPAPAADPVDGRR